jgi:dipeptidyl aminopeptidase/acylaminoacyl peptidase
MKDQFHATSPARHADKIKAPVLMIYGAKDRHVPLDHGKRMRDALKEKGKTVEWIEMPDEEHGITKEANRYKVFGAIEKFLKTHNPAD